jgi:hypothetical protein
MESRKPTTKEGYIMKLLIALCILVGVMSCNVPRVGGVRVAKLNEWYIPTEPSLQRAAVPLDQVAYLDTTPTNRAFTVIGFVSPHPDAFKSYPEIVNAMRAAGSLHGADAVFIDSQSVNEGWKFSFNQWGGGGGKYRKIAMRAKVIVWEK